MSNKGVTLVELLITVVVMGIIAAFSTVAVASIIDNTREKAFVANGKTFIESARLALYDGHPMWNDDVVTLQELIDGQFIEITTNDPWGRPYDTENTLITYDEVNANEGGIYINRITLDSQNTYTGMNVVLKVRVVSQTATIGLDTPLNDFTKEDIIYTVADETILEQIVHLFNKDTTDTLTLTDAPDSITVEGHLKSGGTISTQGGNDEVTIEKSVKFGASIDLGAGNDHLIIQEDMTTSASVYLGEGDDTITIGDDIRKDSVLNTGAGHDVVELKDVIYESSLDTGEGNDTFTAGKIIGKTTVDMGEGDDVVTVLSHVNNSTIHLGSGNDTLTITKDLENSSTLTTGSGADVITIYNDITKSSVNTGSENDTLKVETIKSSTTIHTESGNDTVSIEYITTTFKGTIQLGTDDDTITIDNKGFKNIKGTIDGGSGYDILNLPNMSYAKWQENAADNFSNFELIVLSDRTINLK